MPLIEIVDVLQAHHDLPGSLWGFYIDKPQLATLFDGGVVDTWGWVLGRTRPAVSVEFVQSGRLLRRVPVNVRRPDVAASFSHVPHADRSGFRTEIPIAGRLAEFRIDVSFLGLWRLLEQLPPPARTPRSTRQPLVLRRAGPSS